MSELKIEYNDEMKPTSATCTGCGEKMPQLPSDLQSAADAVVWLAEKCGTDISPSYFSSSVRPV